jgi:hypothetical protein
MIKVSQTITEAGRGDCLPACLASILECDLDRLPNYHDENWWMDWHNFLKTHGLNLISKGRSAFFWDSYWIGIVPSLNFEGKQHAVVMCDNELAHDPNIPPSKSYTELTYNDCVDGYTVILSDAGLFRRSNLYG